MIKDPMEWDKLSRLSREALWVLIRLISWRFFSIWHTRQAGVKLLKCHAVRITQHLSFIPALMKATGIKSSVSENTLPINGYQRQSQAFWVKKAPSTVSVDGLNKHKAWSSSLSMNMVANFINSIERHFLKGLDAFKGSVMNEILLANGLVAPADSWEQKKALVVTFKYH